MKSSIYRLLPFAITGVFAVYWAILFLFAFPSNKPPQGFSKSIPAVTRLFYQDWSLFSPPADYNFRLYFILRDAGTKSNADTIEVLENVYLQKRQKAPFNQREILTDHLLNWNIKKINAAFIKTQYQLKAALPDSSEKYYRAETISILLHNHSCSGYITDLENYSRRLYKKNKVNLFNKEQKIILKRKSIRPYKLSDSNPFAAEEMPIFETWYNPLH